MLSSSICFSTSASMITDSWNRSPPCTIAVAHRIDRRCSPICSNTDLIASAMLGDALDFAFGQHAVRESGVDIEQIEFERRTARVEDQDLHSGSFTGRPAPVPDLRHVLAMRPHVAPVIDQFVLQLLPQVRRHAGEIRHAVDHIDRQMEAVDLVAARTYRTAWLWCLLPYSREREAAGWCAGKSAGESATDSRDS